MNQLPLFVLFNLAVLAMLALDLGVFNRKAHAITLREAAIWSAVWIGLALAFNAFLYFYLGPGPALEFFAGYLIEKSLSVDNIFVFVLIFSVFAVPAAYQHRVLFWGILGALVLRGALIAVGAVLIEQFHWVIYVFGAFLVVTGMRFATQEEEEIHPQKNPLIGLMSRVLPVEKEFDGAKLIVTRAGRRMATPLLVALIVVESTDVLFALDSIPAVFGVTNSPFIVYTSNVAAILGLRALYFLLAGLVEKFHNLRFGLAAILTFVGLKMLVSDLYEIPIAISLTVIAGILVVAAIASTLTSRGSARPAGTSDKSW